jgi:hypothetical protein
MRHSDDLHAFDDFSWRYVCSSLTAMQRWGLVIAHGVRRTIATDVFIIFGTFRDDEGILFIKHFFVHLNVQYWSANMARPMQNLLV